MNKIYYGKETKKARENFPFDFRPVDGGFLKAMVEIKKAAAAANKAAGFLSKDMAGAIVKACDEVLSGKLSKGQFPLPMVQGGAGTSINMNVNEVLAGRAAEILKEKGKDALVHPNDHVNCCQSTNDVNPSALKVCTHSYLKELIRQVTRLEIELGKKAREFKRVQKLARTHLQDAVPTTLGAEFEAYAEVVEWRRKNLERVREYAQILNLGGTAIGNSINASEKYRREVYRQLNRNLGEKFLPAENLMSKTSSQVDFVIISQALVALFVDLSKIANDLKLMSSGPRGGFGEIVLPELQSGSSIMPGKVNPVMPEFVNQVYFIISGNNLAIEHCAQASQLELGVMLPTVADRLLESLKLATVVTSQFAGLCIAKTRANRERCRQHLENSTAYATLLTPRLGYDTVSELVKEITADHKTLRQLVIERGLISEKEFDNITNSYKG